MKIIPSTKSKYALVKWESRDQACIEKLYKEVLQRRPGSISLKGLRIEVSEHDLVPEDVRGVLIDGHLFVVE